MLYFWHERGPYMGQIVPLKTGRKKGSRFTCWHFSPVPTFFWPSRVEEFDPYRGKAHARNTTFSERSLYYKWFVTFNPSRTIIIKDVGLDALPEATFHRKAIPVCTLWPVWCTGWTSHCHSTCKIFVQFFLSPARALGFWGRLSLNKNLIRLTPHKRVAWKLRSCTVREFLLLGPLWYGRRNRK